MEETRIAWLAGVVDGEGCLQSGILNRDNTLRVELRIETVSPPMIDTACQILEGLAIRYCRQPGVWRHNSRRRPIRLSIYRKDDLRRLLLAMLPYLIVKKPEAERILLFLQKSCLVSRYQLDQMDRNLPNDLKVLKKTA